MDEQEAQACAQLVETIEQVRGQQLPPRLRHAFLSVPRRLFVARWYRQDATHRWVRQDVSDEVYADKPLVTKLDQNGLPCSSSSQPSLMAAMLEALDLQPGMRVLEVGTGTVRRIGGR